MAGRPNIHGMSYSSEYKAWKNIRRRCDSKNPNIYEMYGARGIKVCKRWNSFILFFKDMGKKPSPELTIERIDNDKGYSPSNCCWATRKEQAKNRRSNITVSYKGKKMLLRDVAALLGIKWQTIYMRYRKGERGQKLYRPISIPSNW